MLSEAAEIALYAIAFHGVLIGLGFVIGGLFTKTEPTPPICARCRYDLRACPQETTQCPECGAFIIHPSTKRYGRYVRMPIILTLGIAFIVGAFLAALAALTNFALREGWF
jgi:hypothetical protein